MMRLYPKKKGIAIVGPTASGKTELALKLAKKFNGEIINSDSQLVYKDFNIGTDKPRRDPKDNKGPGDYIVSGIKHYLVDFLSPKRQFSIADFKKRAKECVVEIQAKGKIPFLVGGSPLYTDSIVYDYKLPHMKIDKKMRSTLEKMPIEELLAELKKRSEESFAIVDKKNKRRIIRALELAEGGITISRERLKTPKDFLILGLVADREALYEKINKRIDKMISSGLINETRNLLQIYGSNIPPMLGIGYRQLIPYFEGKVSQEEAIANIKRDTRHFAKRQLTWLKRDKNIRWIKGYQDAQKVVTEYLSI